MRNQWEVLVKSDDDNEKTGKNLRFRKLSSKNDEPNYEISVIRKGNRWGHESWGWPSSSEKIILFSPCDFGTEINPYTRVEWNRCIGIANVVCDYLNRSGK